jgi:hypothetical protein
MKSLKRGKLPQKIEITAPDKDRTMVLDISEISLGQWVEWARLRNVDIMPYFGKTTPLWHYTIFPSLPLIMEERIIKPTATFVELTKEPVAWFSVNPLWEESVRKSIYNKETEKQTRPLSRDELAAIGASPARIEVKPEAVPYSWDDFMRKPEIPIKLAWKLEKLVLEWGADPGQWRVTTEPVPINAWLAIEIWNPEDKRWISVEQVVRP